MDCVQTTGCISLHFELDHPALQCLFILFLLFLFAFLHFILKVGGV